jgi:hypothetical protein
MTAEHDEQLEQALTELTTWHGPAPQLWRRALGAAEPKRPRTTSRFQWLLRQRLSAGVAASIIVVALGATIAVNLPHLGAELEDIPEARRRAASASSVRGVETLGRRFVQERTIAQVPELRNELESLGYVGDAQRSETLERYVGADAAGRYSIATQELRGGEVAVLGVPVVTPDTSQVALGKTWDFDKSVSEGLVSNGAAGFELRGDQTPPADEDGDGTAGQPRQIVRKATVELLTNDVRAVFLKAAMVLSEASGEYVQESSITGSGETAQANLILRVAADRLSDVLNALRELGEVRSEQVTGQDVTAQVVDLEARLRNEQRVELELLDLLEKRNDAPLKEILELRNTLSNVRGEIERLTAQRQQLGRLVSLATVLVIIRTDQSQERPADFSIAQYFGDGLARAWQKGLVFLADTFGLLLSILVGGLIWWILLALVFAAIWRYRRRSLAASNSDKP